MDNKDWIFRNENGRIIESLEFGQIEPGSFVSQLVVGEHAKLESVILNGFYLDPLGLNKYLGHRISERDIDEVIRWADLYTLAEDESPGLPGIELTQYSEADEEDVTLQFKSGYGDREITPLPYLGHTNKIFGYKERVNFTIRLNIPSSIRREVLICKTMNFGIGISTSRANG